MDLINNPNPTLRLINRASELLVIKFIKKKLQSKVNFIHDAKIATISRFNDIFFTLESREELFKSWTKYEFDLEGWPKSSLLFIYLFSFRKYRPSWPCGRWRPQSGGWYSAGPYLAVSLHWKFGPSFLKQTYNLFSPSNSSARVVKI